MSILNDLKYTFTKNGNGLTRLIVINTIVFVLVNILNIFFPSLYYYFTLSSEMNLLVSRPWTPITYMFTHKDFFHFLFNMMWLYWMGIIALDFIGSKRLVAIYLLGGLCGGVLFLLLSQFILDTGHITFLLGASGAVMAVVVSIAVLVPNYEIILLLFGRVKLKYLALASFVLTTLIDLNVNTGGKIAHTGGALLGLLFTLLYKQGTDITLPVTKLFSLFEGGLPSFNYRPKMKVAYKKEKTATSSKKMNKAELQEKTDAILDKISKSGYESLTQEEKDILFNASKE